MDFDTDTNTDTEDAWIQAVHSTLLSLSLQKSSTLEQEQQQQPSLLHFDTILQNLLWEEEDEEQGKGNDGTAVSVEDIDTDSDMSCLKHYNPFLLCQSQSASLLSGDDSNCSNNNKNVVKDNGTCCLVVTGYPSRPLYKNLAWRLQHLAAWQQQQQQQHQPSSQQVDRPCTTNTAVVVVVAVPGSQLGFQEDIMLGDHTLKYKDFCETTVLLNHYHHNELPTRTNSRLLSSFPSCPEQVADWILQQQQQQQNPNQNDMMFLLGLHRKTVGTVPLDRWNFPRNNCNNNTNSCKNLDGRLCFVPPSYKALLEAAMRPHGKCNPNNNRNNNCLSVAARARTKHIPRCTATTTTSQSDILEDANNKVKRKKNTSTPAHPYYGSIVGNAAHQNRVTRALLQKLLHETVWINIHESSWDTAAPCLELRTRQGYGARWKLPRSMILSTSRTITRTTAPAVQQNDEREPRLNDQYDEVHDDDIEFRGFLEPQMKDGHEKKWRH